MKAFSKHVAVRTNSAASGPVLVLLSLLMLIGLPPLTRSQSDARCAVHTSARKVNCSYRELTDIPRDIPQDTRYLVLTHNYLSVIRNESFSGLLALVDISLEDNRIYEIEAEAFYGLDYLQTVNLIGNHLLKIPKELFSQNVLLGDAFLRANTFESIPDLDLRAHDRLSSVIDLGKNNISSALFNMALPDKCHVSIIDLSFNSIRQINERDFDGLRTCRSIGLLDVSYNEVKSVALKSLQRLPIIGLVLEGNPLFDSGVEDVFKAVSLAPNITYLDIRSTGLVNLTTDTFLPLASSSVTTLILSRIVSIHDGALRPLSHVESIGVYNSTIDVIPPSAFNDMSSLVVLVFINCGLTHLRAPAGGTYWQPPLYSLSLSNNAINEIPSKVFFGLDELVYLNLEYNYIRVIHSDSFNGLLSLEDLRLNNNDLINTLGNDVFGSMPSLESLDLSESNINDLDPEKSFSGLRRLTKLSLEGNPIHMADVWNRQTNVSVFRNMHYLHDLDLSSTYLGDEIPPACFRGLRNLLQLNLRGAHLNRLHADAFHGLTKLHDLSLDHNDIQFLPPTVFRGQTELLSLHISGNPIPYLDSRIFQSTTKLSVLDLSGTNLDFISEETLAPILENITTIDLSHNSLSCTCRNEWLRHWIKTAAADVLLTDTVCSDDSLAHLGGKPFLEFEPVLLCRPSVILYPCIALVSVVLIACFIVLYYNRWRLSYKCFLLKLFVIGYKEAIDDDDYQFAINIVFHDNDEEWVVERLVPTIRERDPNAVLCVGDDDLPLGMLRLDAVVEVIDNSYKSVFVVSNAAVGSDWFIIKLRLALQHVNRSKRDAVMLVFLEDIADGRLPYLVRLLLSENRPCLRWNNDPRSQDYFWDKFMHRVKITTITDLTLPV